MIADVWNSLPGPLRDPVALAVPAFLVLLALEWTAAVILERRGASEPTDAADRPGRGTYLRADARASISMGLVSIVTTTVWKTVALLGYSVIYAYVAPWHLPSDQWYTWVVLLLGVDVLFYWYHRIAHRTRVIWATHQAHHSSEYFNFSTALRQKWNNSGEIVMWLPLPLLGIPPWMVFTGFAINLVYQFWVHTERIDRMPRWFEFVFNTPSHHRVHHGNDKEYLDKNYAGILIVWDRMFGTYAPETFRPHYGLTTPVNTFDILKLQTHEYAAIARDVRTAATLRQKLGYVFGPPGWAPERQAAASVTRKSTEPAGSTVTNPSDGGSMP
ncbi:C-5 sterol desaturase [Rhodococcus sp. Leaf7]|uniref:sterol desaturase family protein n=1 Tax=unclassified Rhodococcus (in: high G+C Gram-positive bacteria) TaxID=192944 RepID=UPI000701C7D4|nr:MULTISPECIES: sterol desaturase family protein [unclassified Rhodococcus (in: high G+C Gram-positive bacteria)]KQU07594.1 C-5 sterol desaturase [Rhodococcus sp. Leaf7]KQU43114.1 C-5 sterol desaturase [Rhodococcus sp. Leaf247]